MREEVFAKCNKHCAYCGNTLNGDGLINKEAIMGEINFENVSRKYRKGQCLSQSQFGDALSEKVEKWTLSGQAISLWENGGSEPSFNDLFLVFLLYSDWRMEWAIDCIVAKRPKVFARDENGALTVINKREQAVENDF